MSSASNLYIGLMSGTSLDGVDGVIASFSESPADALVAMHGAAYVPFPPELRRELMDLQAAGNNEIHREAIAGNALARKYAECVARLLAETGLRAGQIRAIGAHGQTIRHRPECGYTRQTGNPALLAELSGIDVIADFRSRDIAAGGQGAPLVPAFHRSVFSAAGETRVVANIGGIGNISILGPSPEDAVIGFDTGPGNVLMDGWVARHLGKDYDAGGAWAASGTVLEGLLDELCREPFLSLPPPKSTGRDLFHDDWLAQKLLKFQDARPVDVQATLAAFTARSMAQAITTHAPAAAAVYVCGGGAYNEALMDCLRQELAARNSRASLQSTAALGVSPSHVEALAFAWLAWRFDQRKAGNLASVTGANGPRVLGALYPV